MCVCVYVCVCEEEVCVCACAPFVREVPWFSHPFCRTHTVDIQHNSITTAKPLGKNVHNGPSIRDILVNKGENVSLWTPRRSAGGNRSPV